MDVKLIGVDLDGTLIPDLYTLSEYSVKVFSQLRELGHKIVITTGRPFRSSFFVYKAFDLDTPLINYNGQLITNPKNKNYNIKSNFMDKNIILDVYNRFSDKFTMFFCEYYDNIYANYDDPIAHVLMHHNELSNLYTGDLNEILKNDVHGTLLLAKEGCSKEIKEYINSKYSDVHARVWKWGKFQEIVEIYSTQFSKGNAFKLVREELGFKKEDTIVCGDSMNDLDFFEEAGYKVCCNNAISEIKAIADYVSIYNCEEDGIARFLNEYFDLGITE